MLAFADEIRGRGAGLRVLDLGGGDVHTATPMGSILSTIITDSQIRSARHLITSGEPPAQIARDFGMSRATFYRRSRALTEPSDVSI